MMILLIPSYSMEDFSVDRIDAEANQILSAWSALYHPALIEKWGRLPVWERASSPSENDYELIVVPPCCEHLTPMGWLHEKEEQCVLIRNESDREVIIQSALESLQLTEHGFEGWFVDAFFAMGTHYVLSELLTRQLRYMSMLDEYQLKERAIDAIKAYRNGDIEAAKSSLQQMFEQLQQSREYFYPMSTYFIDLVLTAPTTLGEKLCQTLNENRQVNLVMPMSLLKQVTEEHGELAEIIRRETNESRLELAGDPLENVPLSHLAMPDLVEKLMRGTEFYRETSGTKPVAYMRKQADFVSALPSLLVRAGYQGTLLYTTEGWQTPEKKHSILRWGSPDGRKLGAVTRYPSDANTSEMFLQLPRNLGRLLESDYAPTITLAHFPQHAKRWLNDLFVAQQYAPVFGRFHSLRGYFKATKYTGQTTPLDESLYLKSRQLVEAVEKNRPNPVTAWGDYHQMMQRCNHITTLATLAVSIAGKKSELPPKIFAEARAFIEKFDAAKQQYDMQLYGEFDTKQSPIDLRGFVAEADALIKRFSCYAASILTAQSPDEMLAQNHELSPKALPDDWGYLLVNPTPHVKRMLIDISDLPGLPTIRSAVNAPENASPVIMARSNETRKEALVEVPPLGYAWVGCDSTNQNTTKNSLESKTQPTIANKVFGLFVGKKEQGPPPLVERVEDEGYYLRNEFFELRIDETTGAVVSLFHHNKRGNRLAQQIAFRFPEDMRRQDTRSAKDGNAGYSIMGADKIEVTVNGPLHAALKINGRLMHFDGSVVATFEQTITVSRGSKIVQFDIAIDPKIPPGESPWESYYAARFAWANAGYEPYIGVTSGRHNCLTKYIEAPFFFDMRDESQSITVFAHGLPYHRRTSDTRIDTLLMTTNEERRSFRIDVAVDIDNPMTVAQEQMIPHEPLVVRSPKPNTPTAWLFSFNVKNVVLQKCEPMFNAIWQPTPVDANDQTPELQDGGTSEPGYGYEGVYSPEYAASQVEPETEPRNSIDEGWRFPKPGDCLHDEGRPMTGMRLWLLETEGTQTELSFRSFRPIQKARTVDFELNEEKTLAIPGDRVIVPLGPHEFLPVEIWF